MFFLAGMFFVMLGYFGFYQTALAVAFFGPQGFVSIYVPTTYCKYPTILKEKEAELASKIALVETNFKNFNNKLIERYGYLVAEIDNLIKAKNNEFLLESNMDIQSKLIKYINCLKSIRGDFNFKKEGGLSSYLTVGGSFLFNCRNEFGNDALLESYIKKIDEVTNYKNNLYQEYNRTTLNSEIENLRETIAHYREILKDEMVSCCSSWTYSNWGQCANGIQTRTIISSQPSGCVEGNPVTTQSCTYVPPACTSWTYSNWSSCINNQQTRIIISSQPPGCVNDNPIIIKKCISQDPIIITPVEIPNLNTMTAQQMKELLIKLQAILADLIAKVAAMKQTPITATPYIDCTQFQSVSSCSFVPVGQAQGACKNCFPNK